MTKTTIKLFDTARSELVDADFFDEVSATHLALWNSTWKPVMEAHCKGLKLADKPQDHHWDWRWKVATFGSQLGTHTFAIICLGELQGLMLVNDTSFGRLPGQVGRPLVYVEFLATAPWNRTEVRNPQRYSGVGKVFMAGAIQLSQQLKYCGRIGLHALPNAESFYRHCGMSEVCRDPGKHQYLMYFEMTEQQADAFINQTRKP